MRTANAVGVLAFGVVLLNPALGHAQLTALRDWMSLVGVGSVELRVQPLDYDLERRLVLERDRIYSDLVRRLSERGVPVSTQGAGAFLYVEISLLNVRQPLVEPLFVYSLHVSLHQPVYVAAAQGLPTTPRRVVAPTWVRLHLGTTGELHGPEHMIRQLVDEFAADYRTAAEYTVRMRKERP